MAKTTLIAAIGRNNELGKGNDLIWKIPADLAFFKEHTINKKIIMGKNTLDSLPRLLPKRLHLVLTHQNIEENEQLKVFHDIKELDKYLEELDEEVMVIGGAQIYKQFIDRADSIILTEIDDEANADTYFPSFNKDEWANEILSENEYDGTKYKHVVYVKTEIFPKK